MKKGAKLNFKDHVSFKIAIIYAIFSALWILLSDQILYFMVRDPGVMTKIQMIKGWVFILTSALIIFFLLRKEIRKYSQAEKEIMELSQLRESTIENANIWLNVLDVNGNILIWNRAAEKISGYNKEAVVRHSKVWEWLYPDMEYREEIIAKANAIIQENEIVEDFETNIRRKDGGEKIISWQSRNLKDDQNKTIGSIALGRDITARIESRKRKN